MGKLHKIPFHLEVLAGKDASKCMAWCKTSSKVEPKMKLSTVSFSAVAVQTPQSRMTDHNGTIRR